MDDNVTDLSAHRESASGEQPLPPIKFDINLFAGHGNQLVDRERHKQLLKGFTPEHDKEHHDVPTLARIGVCYMDFAVEQIEGSGDDSGAPHPFWPEDTDIPWNPKEEPFETFVMGLAFGMAALDLAIGLAHEESQVELDEP
jgi:hypothetical protein